jgi:hypothetical protein
MRAVLMMVTNILAEQSLQMAFIQRNSVVQQVSSSAWIIQQLREAFPFEASHKYLIFDRDQKFGFESAGRLAQQSVQG